MTRCPSCRSPLSPGQTICEECGTDVVVQPADAPHAATSPLAAPPEPDSSNATPDEDRRTCPDCGEHVVPDRNGWCPACGYPFDGVEVPLAGAFPPLDAEGMPVLADLNAPDDDPETDRLATASRRRQREENRQRNLARAHQDPVAAARARLHDAWAATRTSELDRFDALLAEADGSGGTPRESTPFAQGGRSPAEVPETPSVWKSDAANQAEAERDEVEDGGAEVGGAELKVEGGRQVFFDGRMTERIPLDVDEVVIGRRDPEQGHYPDVDLTHFREADGHISRRHARVVRRGGERVLEDLSGNEATWLNDRAHLVQLEEVVLQDGDRILISDSVTLVYRAGGER